jgi:hypothetical protein
MPICSGPSLAAVTPCPIISRMHSFTPTPRTPGKRPIYNTEG